MRKHSGIKVDRVEGDRSPFILKGAALSARVTDFLMEKGISTVGQWRHMGPTYHFEVAISAGGVYDSFNWTTSQLKRVRICLLGF